MASKDYYLSKITEYGIDKLPEYEGLDFSSLHYTKLKDILEKHSDIPMTQKDAKESEHPAFAEMIRQLQEQMQSREEQFKTEIEALRQQLSTPQQLVVKTQGSDEEIWGRKKQISIPRDDYEKEPTTFLMFGRGYVTSSYFKDGEERLAPYGAPVMFKYTSASKRNLNGAEELLHISTYRTHSKKEKQWLREHPLYDRGIYEKIKNVLTYDPNISGAIEQVAASVNAMTAQQVFAKANSMGINTDLYTLDKMKTMIITSEAQRLLEADIQRQQSYINERVEQQLKMKEA